MDPTRARHARRRQRLCQSDQTRRSRRCLRQSQCEVFAKRSLRGCMPFKQPFARAAQPQPRAIDDQLKVAHSSSPAVLNRRSARPPTERRMIGDGKIDPQQPHDRGDPIDRLAGSILREHAFEAFDIGQFRPLNISLFCDPKSRAIILVRLARSAASIYLAASAWRRRIRPASTLANTRLFRL